MHKKQLKTTATLLFLLVFGTVLHAQKVTLNGDTIYKEGAPYGILKHTGPGLMMNYTLHDLTGKEAARINVGTVPAPEPRYNGEKTTYWTFDFFDKDLIADCEVKASNKMILAELIVYEHLLDGGTLNIEAAKFFIRVNGNQFTKPQAKEETKND
ncbi:MAG: hypothetical protein U1O81_07910 [Planktothrix rubescens PR223]|jgi:hypothetical protein